MVDRIDVKVSDVHRVLLRDQGGWASIVPGSFNYVYGSMVTAEDVYIAEFAMYVFEDEQGERFCVPIEAVLAMQRHAAEPEIPEEG